MKHILWLFIFPGIMYAVEPGPINRNLNKTFNTLEMHELTTDYLIVRIDETVGNDLNVHGSEIIGGDLTVYGNEIVYGDITVGPIIIPVFIGSIILEGTPQQACIIFLDNTFTEKARICSSAIPGDKGVFVSVDGGVTQNLRVNTYGGTMIAAPSSGSALTVTGNSGTAAATFAGAGTAGALTLTNVPASLSTDYLLTVDPVTGIVREGPGGIAGLIVNGCQPGPLIIGTNNATSLAFGTGACTARLTIDDNGGVTIAAPTAATEPALKSTGYSTTTAPALALFNANSI